MEDQRTGFGSMVYPDGAEFSGIWENGVHKEFRQEYFIQHKMIHFTCLESQETLPQQLQQQEHPHQLWQQQHHCLQLLQKQLKQQL